MAKVVRERARPNWHCMPRQFLSSPVGNGKVGVLSDVISAGRHAPIGTLSWYMSACRPRPCQQADPIRIGSTLGLAKPPKTHHDLSEFCGILKKGEADEIRANIKCFDRIDKEISMVRTVG